MKIILLIAMSLTLLSCISNNDAVHSKNILESRNILEIENYLQKAHPDDPKRKFLQSKIIALKNAEWTKGAKFAKPMAARPVLLEIPMSEYESARNLENETFKNLLAESNQQHKGKTVALLNTIRPLHN